MRIAQIAPLAETVPPSLYGGTERVVSWLTEELVRQGHDVTLFAAGGSETAAKLVVGSDTGLRLLPCQVRGEACPNLVERLPASPVSGPRPIWRSTGLSCFPSRWCFPPPGSSFGSSSVTVRAAMHVLDRPYHWHRAEGHMCGTVGRADFCRWFLPEHASPHRCLSRGRRK